MLFCLFVWKLLIISVPLRPYSPKPYCMKYVKWIFVVLLIGSLTSFVGKDKPSKGLSIGNEAPDFCIRSASSEQSVCDLSDYRGRRVLLSFWSSYDAASRWQNASLNAIISGHNANVEMISVSFDEYRSVFQETVRNDQIKASACFAEPKGTSSSLYKQYRLNRGFTNYLLDENGVIIAKDITSDELLAYLN